MRLLSREGGTFRIGADVEASQKYAILSHRWLSDDDEVSYHDVAGGVVNTANFSKSGLAKLKFCLDQAAKADITHVWIDTCCIDRADKSEVGKAINKMYAYYRDAAVCYVHLADVLGANWSRSLASSQWFTRGWTLQELIAPSDVRFYSGDGKYIGNKDSLSRELLSITGINMRSPMQDVPIHMRFQWTSKRRTTEPEDISYCLLGILEVSLMVNYGEGAESARERLYDAVEKEHGRKTVRQMRALTVASTSEALLDLKESRELLYYDEMNARQAIIAEPYRHTCEWLLRDAFFAAWEQGTCGLLWIKGKPGIGKSTLMKYAASSEDRAGSIRIAFFFNARGGELERTVEGMYRSLLYQLLDRASSTREPLIRYFNQEQRCSGSIRLSIPILQAAFRTAVRNVTESIKCFVDALDECKLSEVQDMIYFLEDVCFDTNVSICFASRYYPSITIKSREILLEQQIGQSHDLVAYVRGRLDASDDLKAQVITKANGLFFWAVLVVRLLNAEISAGRAFNIHRRLSELPGELNALLRAITAPSDDTPQLRLAIQWLLFAMWPLSPEEYYVAVMTGLYRLHLIDVNPTLPLYAATPNPGMLKKFVTSSSRGLAELTQAAFPRVQFIHESVRDYLLYHGGLQDLSPDAQSPKHLMHNELKEMCYWYLDNIPVENMRPHSISNLEHYPLVHYAVTNLLKHTEAAQEVIPQDEFLQLLTARSPEWQDTFCKAFNECNGVVMYCPTCHARAWGEAVSSISSMLGRTHLSQLRLAAHQAGLLTKGPQKAPKGISFRSQPHATVVAPSASECCDCWQLSDASSDEFDAESAMMESRKRKCNVL